MIARQEKIWSPEKKEILWKITYKEFEVPVIKMVTQIILLQFGDKEKVKELNC